MLVSCTVGKNAALPEPNSPDGTPQWRTLSLRVSERYPAESPVALFNCPSDGLPVPPQVSTSRLSCFMSRMLGHGTGIVMQQVVRNGHPQASAACTLGLPAADCRRAAVCSRAGLQQSREALLKLAGGQGAAEARPVSTFKLPLHVM